MTWRENGKIRARSHATKAQAQAHVAELEDNIRTGRYTPPELATQPFSKVAELWLETKINVKPSTLRRYKRDLKLYVLPRWSETPINQITRQQLQAWVHEMSAGTHPYGGENSPGRLSAASIQHAHTKVLGGILRYAVQENWILENPTAKVSLPRDTKQLDLPVLTYLEVEALADAAATIGTRADKLLILTLATCGLRINEALALQAADINLNTKRITVSKAWLTGENHKLELSTPKSGAARKVPLPQFLADELLVHMAGMKPTDWIFHSRRDRSKPQTSSNWSHRVFRPALKKAGIPLERGITPHKLRHTAASHAIAAGASVKLIQQMLGHARATETLDIYGHLFPDTLDTVMDNVAQRRAEALRI